MLEAGPAQEYTGSWTVITLPCVHKHVSSTALLHSPLPSSDRAQSVVSFAFRRGSTFLWPQELVNVVGMQKG